MMKFKVPVNEPYLYGNEKKYLQKCITDGFVSSGGPFVEKFEKKFAKRLKRKFAISVSNGTAALQLAFESLNIKKKDQVILPSFTIISCILPIIRCGAVPILVDSDPVTWNMDVKKIEDIITSKTKAIIAPHIYGLPIDMDPLLKIAKKYKLRVIEDAAEVLGLKYKNKECGSFGDVSTFSFYANKHITTGEGGMILTNDKKIYNKCNSLRNLSFGFGINRFNHDDIGWNYRMTNLQAALGCGQLKKISKIIKRKREIGKRYIKILKNCDKIYIQPYKLKYAQNIFWVFGVLIKKNVRISRDKIINKLLSHNIQTRNFFFPMHKQKIFIKMRTFSRKSKFKNAEYLSKNGFYLPSGLGIKNNEIDYVANTLLKVLEN